MRFSKKQFALHEVLLIIAVIGILSMFSVPRASAQTGPDLQSATNLPATVATATQSATTSYIDLYSDSGLALSWKFNVSSGTSAGVVLLYPSVDKTNYDTTPWIWLRNANGATDVIATTNWSAQQLRGYRSLKIGALTNASAGTLTNKLLLFNRPYPTTVQFR
jgi:Tfp pilus assembly protein FimT